LEAVPGKHSIDSLQKTAVLGTSHIIRKVLQREAWSLSGGNHCWFKRITRKNRHVTREIIIIIITIIIIIIIIITIIPHELGLNTTVSASSNSRFRGLPSCIHPFGLQFSDVHFFSCRSQFARSVSHPLNQTINLAAFWHANRYVYSINRLFPYVLH
jgi:hypothetical protein